MLSRLSTGQLVLALTHSARIPARELALRGYHANHGPIPRSLEDVLTDYIVIPAPAIRRCVCGNRMNRYSVGICNQCKQREAALWFAAPRTEDEWRELCSARYQRSKRKEMA